MHLAANRRTNFSGQISSESIDKPDVSRPYCWNRFSGGFRMSFHLTRASCRSIAQRLPLAFAVAAVIASMSSSAFSQRDNKTQTQSSLSNVQRMDIMRSKLEAMRRSLDSAVAAIPVKDTGDKTKNGEDPRGRLRGLAKEV